MSDHHQVDVCFILAHLTEREGEWRESSSRRQQQQQARREESGSTESQQQQGRSSTSSEVEQQRQYERHRLCERRIEYSSEQEQLRSVVRGGTGGLSLNLLSLEVLNSLGSELPSQSADATEGCSLKLSDPTAAAAQGGGHSPRALLCLCCSSSSSFEQLE